MLYLKKISWYYFNCHGNMGLSITSQSNLKICVSPLYNNHNFGDKVLSKGQKGNLLFIYLNGKFFLGLGYHNRLTLINLKQEKSQSTLADLYWHFWAILDDNVNTYPYLSIFFFSFFLEKVLTSQLMSDDEYLSV